jgi:nucleoside-triphosphatase THEP1
MRSLKIDMKKVFLISGKLQSGKNTFASFFTNILKNKGFNIIEDMFASDLKLGAKEDFQSLGIVLKNIVDELRSVIYSFSDLRSSGVVESIEKTIDKLILKDENFFENKTDISRVLLQLYGTQIFRNRVDNNWWANQVKQRIIEKDYDVYIVTDCRFPNEIEIFYDLPKNIQVYTIRIERNNINNNIMNQHHSEIALDHWKEWDYIVDNIGSLEQLKESSNTIINDILNEELLIYNQLKLAF